MEEYRMMEIQGRHGIIKLGIPKREATQEEIVNLHRTVARIIVENEREKNGKKKPAE